ncbi:MAG: hypothetical protein EOO74_03515, partial [Myxococcales bacterium]
MVRTRHPAHRRTRRRSRLDAAPTRLAPGAVRCRTDPDAAGAVSDRNAPGGRRHRRSGRRLFRRVRLQSGRLGRRHPGRRRRTPDGGRHRPEAPRCRRSDPGSPPRQAEPGRARRSGCFGGSGDGRHRSDLEKARNSVSAPLSGPASHDERAALGARLNRAVAAAHNPSTPLVVVDIDAFDANGADLVRRAGGTPIRVASKSLRVPSLIHRALSKPGFAGVLAYSLNEAVWLAREGITDIVMGYPSVDSHALQHLVDDPGIRSRITLMVDCPAHLNVVKALGDVTGVRIAIDIDAGLRVGPAHIGPKRSPLRDADEVVALAKRAQADGFVVAGVMTYEGQVAGVQDIVPGERAKSAIVRKLKDASVTQLLERRPVIARALKDIVDLEFWNAGGSGSVESTVADPVVTEVAAGSGLLVPALFDHY